MFYQIMLLDTKEINWSNLASAQILLELVELPVLGLILSYNTKRIAICDFLVCEMCQGH